MPPSRSRPIFFTTFLAMAVSACTELAPVLPGQAVRGAAVKAPPGAPEGTCWDTEIMPAIVETVTRQEIIRPAELDANGNVTKPAIVRSSTQQEILRPRSETWFQTLCPAQLSPDTVATLQRALAARGHFTSRITGTIDRPTQTAIRRYQNTLGLDSDQLSLENARKLGLVTIKL
ncbi:peptidoglycan-binding domain-containing protein [Epibacterium ulvae]|uniref:peptidoglycan-binding domain-containing protein n=1 Tax=Epibacterium ulvae TaxID=1156985 RepID=UPI002492A8CC|nr:peptidoglycan-binding domain-containing protein [Epibacterium ulvae]